MFTEGNGAIAIVIQNEVVCSHAFVGWDQCLKETCCDSCSYHVLVSRVEEIFEACHVFEFDTIGWFLCLCASGSATDSYGLVHAFYPTFNHPPTFTRVLGLEIEHLHTETPGYFRTISLMGFLIFFADCWGPRVLQGNMPFVYPLHPMRKKRHSPRTM